MKINHVTTAHPRNDTRVFHKIFKSVKRRHGSVKLYVSDGKGNDYDNVVIDTCQGNRNSSRITKIFRMAKSLIRKRNEIIHFHDPELIPLMLILSLRNHVIFDIHEDFLSSIPVKFNSGILKLLIKQMLKFLLILGTYRFYFILAEADYKRKYNSRLSTSVVLNLPDLDLLKGSFVTDRPIAKTVKLLYIGSLTVERGIETMCEIITRLNEKSDQKRFELHLIGDGPAVHYLKPSPFIVLHGRLDLLKAYDFSRFCHFGLCLLHPTENYLNSIPTKILEYNAVNLPFFVSDFPFYRLISEELSCAMTVDYENVDFIVSQIQEFSANEALYCNMLAKWTYQQGNVWAEQEKNMFVLYDHILNGARVI